MKNRYFYLRMEDERILGPFPASTLDKMYRAGTLSGESPLSTDKIVWKPLKEVFYESEEPEKEDPGENSPDPIVKVTPGTALDPAQKENPAGNADEGHAVVRVLLNGDPLMLIGSALNLMWNAEEKMQELSQYSWDTVRKFVLPVCLLFPLLAVLGAAGSVSFFFAGTGRRMLLGLLVFAVIVLLNGLLLCFCPQEGNRMKKRVQAALLMGTVWLNAGACLCIEILNCGIAEGAISGPRAWSYGILTFTAVCFFFINTAYGIRSGMEHFFGLQPRKAFWVTAACLWLNAGVLLLAGKICF